LIYYRSRASWQEFGFLPYRDYWSEYPPLFAWFTVWIDNLARLFPAWEDERFWYAAFFGAALVVAESVTFVCLYLLARRLWGERALRVVLALRRPLPARLHAQRLARCAARDDDLRGVDDHAQRAFGVGHGAGRRLMAGVGGALKLVPLAILAVTPLATRRWRAGGVGWRAGAARAWPASTRSPTPPARR
jgi:hypothetical protein